MKLGVFTVVLGAYSTEDAFKYLSNSGVQAVEIGTGGFPGTAHANPDELLADDNKVQALLDLAKKYNLEINALSCHG
ncbi:MAG: sugar phosphate isomerase/epimerase, partial [Clostridiales bacterium]|nr:sugar phosphate isomerase/epimerase [Clostridiales bacterium]